MGNPEHGSYRYEDRQYGCEKTTLGYLDGRPCVGKFSRDIRKQVSDSVETVWEQEMKQRSTLTRYRNFKKIRGSREVQYDNSRGSALLALARAGALQTRSARARYVQGEEGTCHNCGVYEETIEHILHECGDRYASDIDTDEMLGFSDAPQIPILRRTKRILTEWENTTRSADIDRL